MTEAPECERDALVQISCHLSFDGNCEAAFSAYRRILGGELMTLLTYAESPLSGQVPADWQSKVMHATLRIGNQELLGADVFPGATVRHEGFAVVLGITGVEQGRTTFDALAEGGNIKMPFQQTFWSPGYGMLVDRFGVPWEINSENAAQSAGS